MKKFFLFFPLFLFAGLYPDFGVCLKKFSFIKNSIPVSPFQSITFEKKNCVKYDPFTGMCLINSKNRKTVKFTTSPKLAWWCASVRKNEIYVGNYAKKGYFLNPDELSVKSVKNSVISDMFCRAVGIGNGRGFFRSEIVNHFIKYGYWGDVGIDVDEDMNIVSFDPFYVKGLRLNEKIKYINGKKATPLVFEKEIVLGKAGKKIKITANKTFYVTIRKKVYNYTPLEHYGIKVDKYLHIVSISPKLKNRYFISKGAKIYKVNSFKVSSVDQLKKLLSTYKNVTISLIQDGIEIQIPLRK